MAVTSHAAVNAADTGSPHWRVLARGRPSADPQRLCRLPRCAATATFDGSSSIDIGPIHVLSQHCVHSSAAGTDA